MINSQKEVRFDIYCRQCKYEKIAESESPCDDCMTEPARCYSRKPVRFEQKDAACRDTDSLTRK